MDLYADQRIVMTLDAGGTNFRFSVIQAGKAVGQGLAMPSHGDDLPKCLENIVTGFTEVKRQCPAPPVAISFAFPGPTDYPHGIIGDLGNLPGFRGGVALGPMLADRFGIPVYLNNDGDLFVYGEAMGFYSFCPGDPTYSLARPMFDEVTIQTTRGETFTVRALNNGPTHMYIQSARLNGKALEAPFFTHAQLVKGGVLELTMGAQPNRRALVPE